MQRTEKRSAARRATAGLAVANSRERNNGDVRLSARPKGVHRIGQFGVAYRDVGNEREQGRGSVAALGKDWAIASGRRLALADWVGPASENITLIEYHSGYNKRPSISLFSSDDNMMSD